MPPKKDKKADADAAAPASDSAKAALEILSLQEKLRSSTDRLSALEAEHKKVASQLSLQKEDQKEIFEYLNMQMRTLSQQVLSRSSAQQQRPCCHLRARFAALILALRSGSEQRPENQRIGRANEKARA
jgi:seryl-tRNA synthetase